MPSIPDGTASVPALTSAISTTSPAWLKEQRAHHLKSSYWHPHLTSEHGLGPGIEEGDGGSSEACVFSDLRFSSFALSVDLRGCAQAICAAGRHPRLKHHADPFVGTSLFRASRNPSDPSAPYHLGFAKALRLPPSCVAQGSKCGGREGGENRQSFLSGLERG